MSAPPSVLAFDGKMLGYAVKELLESTSLGDHVETRFRDSAVGVGQVLEVHVREDAPRPSAWSSGEKVLWAYAASLAGQGEVDLRDLAGHFDLRTDLATSGRLVSCLAALLGADE